MHDVLCHNSCDHWRQQESCENKTNAFKIPVDKCTPAWAQAIDRGLPSLPAGSQAGMAWHGMASPPHTASTNRARTDLQAASSHRLGPHSPHTDSTKHCRHSPHPHTRHAQEQPATRKRGPRVPGASLVMHPSAMQPRILHPLDEI